MNRSDIPKVYPITSTENRFGRSHLEQVQAFLAAGANLVQVRDKRSTDRELFQQLLAIRDLCRDSDAKLIVNDRVDLALACGAQGVHLGQDDLPVEAARSLAGTRLIIGLSTHNESQFLAGLQSSADYLAVGPVFPTGGKENPDPETGLEILTKLGRLTDRPLIAIGGINLSNVGEVLLAGADSAAVISDLQVECPEERLRRYWAETAERVK